LTCLKTIFYLPETGASEGDDEALVDHGGGFDPFVVGAGKTVGGVDPCPHYEGAGGGEDEGVGEGGDED
jgi:hypothetical protein